MFSVNMLLNIIIAASTSLLWSLINVLQVLRYILMINIITPSSVKILIKYLAVAVGDIEELQDLVPNMFRLFLNNTEIGEAKVLYPKFKENGKFV